MPVVMLFIMRHMHILDVHYDLRTTGARVRCESSDSDAWVDHLCGWFRLGAHVLRYVQLQGDIVAWNNVQGIPCVDLSGDFWSAGSSVGRGNREETDEESTES